ncbi:plasmid mobilization protein [Mangrovibacterium diazotrophicum]|uniref:Mobilization protein MobC n=1 Tax=Mangrovibacterium diazotrophicum TaxID=1261403 RepID=A0A419VW90_9BACT|nr:plasmid mobilization relaxosome protein MobC [Mangrovibacterium diazotrophicum]RKD86413.1 mobilization protein MobC [Mangrovibacterium diazotrophicum]
MSETTRTGRPHKQKSEKRTYRINVKLNTGEYYQLKGKARSAGMNLSEFVRQAVGTVEVKERVSPDLNIQIRKLTGMANNLNQIAKKANAGGYHGARGEYLQLAEGIDKLLSQITHDC